MNEALEKAIKDGEVFSKDYVRQLRDEAKANRLKADKALGDAATFRVDAETFNTKIAQAVEGVRKESDKKITMSRIDNLCERAGVKINAGQIYQDGVDPEIAFKSFAEKNKSLFEKESVKIKGVNIGSGDSVKILTEGNMAETRKNPEARSMLSRIYSRLVQEDKQSGRRLPQYEEE